jgi:hypothetical protein
MGALRSYVSVTGGNPYMLLEWPASMDLPRVGSRVSLKLLPPVVGMGTSTEGLAAVFSTMELAGLKVVSIEGQAAREYSNVLHHNAPTKDARAVKLEIPAGSIRTSPGTGKGENKKKKGSSSKRALPAAGKLRKVERLGRVPEVARGPVELLDPKPPRPSPSPLAAPRLSPFAPPALGLPPGSDSHAAGGVPEGGKGVAGSAGPSAGALPYRPRITARQWHYVLAGIGSAVVLAGAGALLWGGRRRETPSRLRRSEFLQTPSLRSEFLHQRERIPV